MKLNPGNRIRMPAGEVERLILERLKMLLTSPKDVVRMVDPIEASPDTLQRLTEVAARSAADLESPNGGTRRSALLHLLDRVVIRNDGMTLYLRTDACEIPDESAARTEQNDQSVDADLSGDTAMKATGSDIANASPGRSGPVGESGYPVIEIPASLTLARSKTSLVIEGEPVASHAGPDKALVKAIARAVTWGRQLTTGQFASIAEIARTEQVTDRYVHRLLPLALLDPDIILGIMDGHIKPAFTGTDLMAGINLPALWSEQPEALVGMGNRDNRD